MGRLKKGTIIFLQVGTSLLLILVFFIMPIDKNKLTESPYYQETLHSIQLPAINPSSALSVGFAKQPIPLNANWPMAGYGKRNPLQQEGVRDSVYISGLCAANETDTVFFLSAELLIIHPTLTSMFYTKWQNKGGVPSKVYLGATHTHSSIGGWAPGRLGKAFAGDYVPEIADSLAEIMVNTLLEAKRQLKQASFSFAELEVGDHVFNRLIPEGDIDPWLKVATFTGASDFSYTWTSYSAHATVFGPENRFISGDYPGRLIRHLDFTIPNHQAMFMAGAVGSMGPAFRTFGPAATAEIAETLSAQIQLLTILGMTAKNEVSILAFQVPIKLPNPQMRISKHLVLRPWIFKNLSGIDDQQVFMQVHVIDRHIWIGLPCDFSGELAVHLYEKARAKGYQLSITSFNGGYIGYVIDDSRYDLNAYESRTMSWYGPYMGSYFSDLISHTLNQLP